MMKRRNNFKFALIPIIIALIGSLLPNAFSAWAGGEAKTISISKNTDSVCYIDDPKYSFPTIESAVKAASSDTAKQNKIYVIPGTTANPAKINISKSIKIASGDALILPYESTTYNIGTNYTDGGVTSFAAAEKLKTIIVTLKTGCSITLDGGALIIGGWVGRSASADIISNTTNKHCELILEKDSSIIINKESANTTFKALECYGFIRRSSATCNSHIDVKAGTVVVPFVIYDAKGGNNTQSLISAKVFPFYIYDFPNLEIDVTYHYGSNLLGIFRMPVNALITTVKVDERIPLVGTSKCVFLLKENSYVKLSFKPETHRVITEDHLSSQHTTKIELYGNCAISSISLKVSTANLNSEEFFLPISYRFHITCYPLNNSSSSELSLDNDLLLLAGSYLKISPNVTLKALKSMFIEKDFSQHNTNCTYPSEKYPYELFPNGATFICDGKLVPTAKIGGRIQTTVENAELDLSNTNISNTFEINHFVAYEGSGTYQVIPFDSGAVRGYADNVSNIDTPFEQKQYFSKKDSATNIFYWESVEEELSLTVSISSNPSTLTSSGGTVKFTANIGILPANSNYSLTWYVNDTEQTNYKDKTEMSYTFGSNQGTWSKPADKNYTIKVKVIHGQNASIVKEVSTTMTVPGEQTCFTPETKILLANGSHKMAKDITKNDIVVTYNHKTGNFEEKQLIWNAYSQKIYRDVIKLKFSNGNILEICEGHALFDVEENKYMTYYGSDFYNQIGQEFLSVNSNSPTGFIKTTLIDVSIENQYIETFTPISENNLNVIAEGMLTMPDDIEGILEFYNFNSNYMFDLNYINDEVNKYGLYEYKNFENIMPEYLFNALNFEMFRVYIRKGLLSYTDVNYYLDRWLEQIITFNNLDWDISNRIPMGPEHV